VDLPASNETVSFALHIKPLFRSTDRESMGFAFDLWSYDDVSANGRAILERLSDGTMPCDEPWSEERVALFRRWVESEMSQ
jgi:hypothetical protein